MIIIPTIAGILALLTVLIIAGIALKSSPGTEKMRELSLWIQQGARTFLKREYIVVGIIVIIVFGGLSFAGKWQTGISFVIGAVCSALAGYVAMSIATSLNARTAEAAKKGLEPALSISFSGGISTGLFITGIGLLGLIFVFSIFKASQILENIMIVNGYAMGASLVALFARAGGGIYTKGADMGADLVGKVEAGIPEDDPRNAGVIADNVGDNVGDIAGLGADLFESYVESIIATLAIGASLLIAPYMIDSSIWGNVQSVIALKKPLFLPLYLASWGIIASIIGALSVKALKSQEPQNVLNSGVYIGTILMMIGSFFIIKKMEISIGLFGAMVGGLFSGLVIGWVSEFYTSSKYRPTRMLAESAQTGPAVVIVNGLGLGMGSTLIPVLILAGATFLGFTLAGMYGVALAAFGMLSILGITLAVDSYGPVADNAGGIAEMAELGAEVRKTTDKLDAVGNTTAAIGKGFAIGSAAFASLGLFAAYLITINALSTKPITLSLTDPKLMCGLLIGGMIPYLFASLLAGGVGRVAFGVIEEVRRQFKEIPGLMEGKAKPDPTKCVDIAAKGALKNMLIPGILVILVPVVAGFLLGPVVLAGILMGTLVVGLVLGIQTANSGAALDNAKKYIEEGNLGGKGSDAHKAAVVGDTVGDPLKDTIGPSINILIKLMAVISLVLAPLFVR